MFECFSVVINERMSVHHIMFLVIDEFITKVETVEIKMNANSD